MERERMIVEADIIAIVLFVLSERLIVFFFHASSLSLDIYIYFTGPYFNLPTLTDFLWLL